MNELAGFLGDVPPFTGFPPALLDQVAARCTIVHLPAGDWLFRQRDEGDALYVVRTGRLELLREETTTPANAATAVGLLGPGEALGELSLLLGEPRSLSARAIRDSELVRLDRAEVLSLLRDSAEFAAGLTRVVAHSLHDRALARGMADAQGSVLTVVALHPGASIDALRTAMAAIPARRRVAVLSRPDPDTQDPADYSRILDQAEREHDRVFLLAGAEASSITGEPGPWDRFCLRQADRVVALVPPELHPPQPGVWPELDGCDLVFWSSPTRAHGTADWLDRLRPRSHHFVDPADLQPTLARALRRLAGLSVGVVLSGGGARAMAHIGALDGLVQGGVQVDRIGGTSFGALVGSLFALGLSPVEIASQCRHEFVRRWPFNDYTIPRAALLRGARLRGALVRMFGDECIERSPRDCFVVSADLLSSELVVHRRGPFAHAVQAGLALPGMLPPVRDDGRLLIDGSVLSGLPIRVMAEADEGPVIAVDVVGGRLKVRRRRRQQALPGIVETISRSAIIGGSSDAAAVRRLARLVIEPDTSGVGQLDFNRLDALVEAGRQAARAALDSAGDLLTGNVTVQSGGDGG
ncbi:MAG TPA: patatin-like phospholipase family protein [Acidimicrobiales bacterium]|nr:patatin-like phospholipase family protein [Acidimicrobiales bacterium]